MDWISIVFLASIVVSDPSAFLGESEPRSMIEITDTQGRVLIDTTIGSLKSNLIPEKIRINETTFALDVSKTNFYNDLVFADGAMVSLDIEGISQELPNSIILSEISGVQVTVHYNAVEEVENGVDTIYDYVWVVLKIMGVMFLTIVLVNVISGLYKRLKYGGGR